MSTTGFDRVTSALDDVVWRLARLEARLGLLEAEREATKKTIWRDDDEEREADAEAARIEEDDCDWDESDFERGTR